MVKYRDVDAILDVLGVPLRRRMVERLARGGAMSVSKMSEPFDITLPAAMKHVRALQDSGIITTHKRGRVRICVLNKHAFESLAGWLATQTAFWQGSFDRLERHINRVKRK